MVIAADQRQWMRTPKAAKRLDLSESTLNKLRLTGGGPPFSKLGRAVVYDARELDAWADSRRRTSTSHRAPQQG